MKLLFNGDYRDVNVTAGGGGGGVAAPATTSDTGWGQRQQQRRRKRAPNGMGMEMSGAHYYSSPSLHRRSGSCDFTSDSRQIVVNSSARGGGAGGGSGDTGSRAGGGGWKRNKAIIILSVLILLVNYCNGLSATDGKDEEDDNDDYNYAPTTTTGLASAPASITGDMPAALDTEEADDIYFNQGIYYNIICSWIITGINYSWRVTESYTDSVEEIPISYYWDNNEYLSIFHVLLPKVKKINNSQTEIA